MDNKNFIFCSCSPLCPSPASCIAFPEHVWPHIGGSSSNHNSVVLHQLACTQKTCWLVLIIHLLGLFNARKMDTTKIETRINTKTIKF